MRMNEWMTDNPERTALTLMVFEDDGRALTPAESFQLNMILRNVANHLLANAEALLRKDDSGKKIGKILQEKPGRYSMPPSTDKNSKRTTLLFQICGGHLEELQAENVSEFQNAGAL